MANLTLNKQRNYHRLASLMVNDQDLAIFRRFDKLNMISLLSMQAEILHLEGEYLRQCEDDNSAGDGRRQNYSIDFHSLRKSKDSVGTEGEQYRLLNNLQTKLSAYSM